MTQLQGVPNWLSTRIVLGDKLQGKGVSPIKQSFEASWTFGTSVYGSVRDSLAVEYQLESAWKKGGGKNQIES